jgi:hypothetical protein
MNPPYPNIETKHHQLGRKGYIQPFKMRKKKNIHESSSDLLFRSHIIDML